MNYLSLCLFGHSKIEKEIDKTKLYSIYEDYILNKNVGIFYFGGFGEFDDISHEVITELKQKYSYIKRIYVCEDYKFISRPNKRPKWLNNRDYEDFVYFDMRYTGFYQRIYFRNCEIIDHSDFCVFYVDETITTSGANKTLKYAKQKKKDILNIYNTT